MQEIKSLRISEIVHSVSITHKFEQSHLYAINTGDIEDGSILNCTYTPTEDLKGQFKKTIQNGDILFSEIRPANRRFAKVEGLNNPMDYVVSTKLMVLRKFNDLVDADYFYYCLTNQSFLNVLQMRAENRIGSFPQITFELLSEYSFPIPSLEEQRQIVHVLSTIDDKIANNNAICAELEAMVKLLYDYWFVQFDFPDENGRPYKSSGGKMVWNEDLKREIPEGWEAATFEDFIKIGNGKDHKLLGDGNIPVYGSGGLMRYANQSIYEGESVLIPRKGTLNNIMYVNEAFWTVDTMYFSVMKKPHSAIFMYYTAKLYDYERLNTGTGVPSMTASLLYSLKAIAPPAILLHRFDVVARTFYDEIQMIANESKELVSLRDFLLPMLMNGQVSFKEANNH